MNKLKHVAIFTPDPEKTARFYQDVFDLEVAGPAGTGFYLTDGHINLAILKAREDEEGKPIFSGIEHFGFQVDDVEENAAQACRGRSRRTALPCASRRRELLLRVEILRPQPAGHRRIRQRLGRHRLAFHT